MSAEMPLIDIRPDHWEIVQRILQEHVPDLEVWAFGSRAKWNAKAFSDLDLAIITDEPLPIDTSAALNEAFSESDLPWKVDVVDWASVGDEFRKIIERDKVVVQGEKRQAWRSSVWGNEVTLEYGKALRGYSQTEGKYRVFGSNGPIGWTHDALVKGPGVILGRKGAYRGVEFSREPFWVIDTAYYLSPKTDLDLRWLYYAAKHYKLGEVDDGSPIPSTTRAAVYMLELDVPPEHEQQAIANILGALDDKIELNRKQNETLEAMARAMFKAWFVDFEPVRAKLEGRWKRGQSLPGLPAHLYDLFPDRLIESELGKIPEGWGTKSLDSIANYLNGLALQKYPHENDEEFLPVIKIAQLRSGSTLGADRASTRIGPEYIVDNGDVLFSWSGSLEVELWSGGRGALNQHLFKVTSEVFPKWFYFFATRHHLPGFREIAAGKATTMGHIQRKHLTGAKIAVPSMADMKAFDDVIAPLFTQLIDNAQQSSLLIKLRDGLLPKLIFGDLRMNAQGFLESSRLV